VQDLDAARARQAAFQADQAAAAALLPRPASPASPGSPGSPFRGVGRTTICGGASPAPWDWQPDMLGTTTLGADGGLSADVLFKARREALKDVALKASDLQGGLPALRLLRA
jgi:hypothetical protein